MGNFLPFYPPKSPNNQNLKKIKKIPGDTIILQYCTKNYDYRLYCSWDLVHDGLIVIFHFGLFLPPLTAQKRKISQKWKNTWIIISLHKCTKTHDHILYCSWDMVCDGCNCYFQFDLVFGTSRKVVNSCFNCTSIIPLKDNEPWSSQDELALQNNIDTTSKETNW